MTETNPNATDHYEVSDPKILIVDDSRIIRVALKKILQEDYETEEAEDGVKALEKIVKGEFDLIITDLEMPNLNGFALIEKIRSHHENAIKHLPILIISGDELDQEKTEALQFGATDYLLKPFNSNEVLKTVNALLRLSAQHKAEFMSAGNVDQDGHVDRLTGLGNLSHFHIRGDQELAFAKRHNKKMAVALIHFDGFSIHQNHLGKKAVYQLIKQAGKFIVDCARTEDTVSRIREDRYGVILSMCNMIEAKAMVDRLMKQVHETRFKVSGKTISFTISVGVCSPSVQKVDDFSEIVISATKILDQAVSTGGDTVILADEYNNHAVEIKTDEDIMNLSLNSLMSLIEEKDPRIEPYLPQVLENIIPLVHLSSKKHNLATQGFIEKIKKIT